MRRIVRKRLVKRLERDPDRPPKRRGALIGALVGVLGFLGFRRLARRASHTRRAYLPHEPGASRAIALLFTLSTAAGIGLVVVYARGGQTQLEGALLGIALGGIGLALILWGKYLFPHEVVTEERDEHASAPTERARTEQEMAATGGAIVRRTFLVRLGLAAAAAFGAAMVFPVASLGPAPGESLFRTAWTRGKRLVDEDGDPIKVGDLAVGGVVTVFPEGHTHAEDAQAIVVKVEEDLLELPHGRESWAPDGNVCYSKLCTHAGCPVGLYLSELHELQCPCHQSAFDVLNGAQVVFGPAARPLPQLQIYADEEGFLRAAADFDEPVGPSYWNRTKQ